MLQRIGLTCASALLLLLLLPPAFNHSASAQSALPSPQNNFQPAKAAQPAYPAPTNTDRLRDGLLGPVRRVRTETAKLVSKNGALFEQPRVLLEVAAYDLKGTKTENAYFPVSGEALTGKEVYKYDEKGNISEMTLQGADGALLSKETYTYEYDMLGNWTRMATSVAVVVGGKLSFEPVEVTYRTITYYLDENMAKMMAQPASPALPPVVSLDKSRMMAGTESVNVAVNAATAKGASVPAVQMSAEPPSAPPAPKPLLKPVSGGVLNGKALSLPKPIISEAAKRMRLSETLNIEVVIDETGKVISARALNGNMMLRDACVQAARRAQFSPTMISGQPVKVSGNITYNVNLAQ